VIDRKQKGEYIGREKNNKEIFSMNETKEILSLTVEIGDMMLRSGAEIFRVEDSMIHILDSFGLDEYDVYVLSNGIFASANEKKDDACSVIRHVPLSSTHLGKVIALNQLTRDICGGRCTIAEAWERLADCGRIPAYPPALQLLSCGLVCGAFAFLFEGSAPDAAVAFCIGVIEQLFLFLCQKKKVTRFLTTLYTSLLISLLSALAVGIGLPVVNAKVVIGSIMPIVPGIALTTSIRDIHNGDYLSGAIHLLDALLTALCIAVGISVPILVLRYLGGVL
jgi:uncharacterized membrane protein YjjP (DUF1212 family)